MFLCSYVLSVHCSKQDIRSSLQKHPKKMSWEKWLVTAIWLIKWIYGNWCQTSSGAWSFVHSSAVCLNFSGSLRYILAASWWAGLSGWGCSSNEQIAIKTEITIYSPIRNINNPQHPPNLHLLISIFIHLYIFWCEKNWIATVEIFWPLEVWIFYHIN